MHDFNVHESITFKKLKFVFHFATFVNKIPGFVGSMAYLGEKDRVQILPGSVHIWLLLLLMLPKQRMGISANMNINELLFMSFENFMCREKTGIL